MTASETQDTDDEIASQPEELAAQVELLNEENQRLRREYTRARKSEYRRIAYGLTAVGLFAVIGGVVFPDGRNILFSLGFTGLFGAVLTLYLTPTQVVAADVGERVYAAMASNGTALANQLALSTDRLYIPDDERAAQLYIPQGPEYEYPDGDTPPLVVADQQRGLLFEATGAYLFAEFERALSTPVATEPVPLGTQLEDGIVEQFELAEASDVTVDPDEGRATFQISGSAFGPVDRFDHPLASFLATGFVTALDRPVSLEVEEGDSYADWLVTCRWTPPSEN